MKRILFIGLLFLSWLASAQFSKTHYIPPISLSADQPPQGQYLYVSCPSLTPVNFRILEIGGNIIEGTVTRDNPYIHSIGSGFNTQLIVDPADVSSVQANKGFIVEAEDMVYVTVRLTATVDNFQAGGIVSKGIAALGTQFRIGAFTNTDVDPGQYTTFHFTFAAILATENNTTVHFEDIKTGAVLLNNQVAGNTPSDVILNRGESYVIAVQGPNDANRDALIGMLVSSDKPIAVNCGSASGSNANQNLDMGIDQIVSAERTGKEYIFIRGNGPDATERPMIVAHYDNTEVYLYGDTTPVTILNAGEYYAPYGSVYTADGNLYVRTSQDAFAYQSIGGTPALPNQNMSFVPPLRCETPKIINNIPYIGQVGNITDFVGNVAIVTETGATLDFIINGTDYTLASLPAGITVTGPMPVTGNPGFETYTFQGLDGNISVLSSKQVYVSYFGSSGAATYGGFYSGFTFRPEITFSEFDATGEGCIPNAVLAINELNAFDQYQWYFNDNPIPGATSNTYQPQEVPAGLGAGYYYVKAAISGCGTDLISDKIPVSSCTADFDSDLSNDNADIDLDNDGMTNCTESYGDVPFDLTVPGVPKPLTIGSYLNSYTYTVSTTPPLAAIPFTGNADGSFVSEAATGPGNSVGVSLTFATPLSMALTYVDVAPDADLLTPYGDFVATVPPGSTLTVLNPNDDLLIDTNYDGIYENGITQYSSFEVRFRLNSSTPLAAGTGTFRIAGHNIGAFRLTHRNLNETDNDRATFRLITTCVPMDSDGDGIPDQLDSDSDNDGISDLQEGIGAGFSLPVSFIDANADGLADSFPLSGNGTLDTDTDLVPDRLDLDTDNDGVYDLVEAGYASADANLDGKADGSVGTNGLADVLETTPDSGVWLQATLDTDADGTANYLELDSDADACNDVIEAGFADPDTNGIFGSGVPTVTATGAVAGAAYTAPNSDYTTAAPIAITVQPLPVTQCENQSVSFSVASNGETFRWQVSTNGSTFTDLSESALYVGTLTQNLSITDVVPSMNGWLYRLRIDRAGNACGLVSDAVVLTVHPKPVIPATATLVQCDDDLDGFSDFNLRQKETVLSANAANETFTYYFSENGALTSDATNEIPDPTVFNNATASTVWVRAENANGCYDTTRLDLVVSITQIPPGTSWSFARCDDFLSATEDNHDGVSAFDLTPVTNDINALLGNPANYTIAYFRNEADALSESNAITNIANYRNIGYPNQQQIWVRVDSNADNACFGLGPYITLTVETVPIAHPIPTQRSCEDDPNDAVVTHAFDTSAIQNDLLQGQTNLIVAYTDASGQYLGSTLPNPFVTATQDITVTLTNAFTADPNGPCSTQGTLSFIVDAQPVANPVSVPAACDDDRNNEEPFDTLGLQNTILGSQTGFVVTYTTSDGTALPSPLPNPFTTADDTITVTVTNPANPDCKATTTVAFTVHPVPELEADYTAPICTGTINNTVDIDAGLLTGSRNAFSYQWTRDGNPIAASYGITATQPGDYAVTVTNRATGCSSVRRITLTPSEAATIDAIVIEDLRDNNTLLVTASGTGDYRYRLDDGVYGDSPFFENVEPGIHEVFVTDANGCGTVSETVAVVGAMKFFTPNGDTFNDYWHLKGITGVFHRNSTVYVFDRFGKLIASIPNGNKRGWDGTYNGQPMPADDYWFLLHLDDGREWRGHFTLKR
ncbi:MULTISPECIES: T9SS type B sorting domain-containing protein [unclassified Flavobacterium]|uniref:T9SS type B sorting domain-containing protein n=1 Tax=unclassified Flavobacterium TaxID=196869 RepID=UPI001F13EC88|nr:MULTISPECIES: T9SS type B sorting domain-containing protein [unclassified Flavobacterium]UMY64339.1 T9SS type B sorting domain-containing protein [Flavobacterium sp. HJ-32-4]